LICTLKSTVAFFLLFFTLDLAFLMLGIGYLHLVDGAPDPTLIHAGGGFGLLAAFLAWYNALAGIADTSNRYVAPDLWFILLHRARQAASRPTPNFARILLGIEHRRTLTDRASLTASSSFPSHTSRGPKRAGRREPVTKQRRGKRRTR
jgi:hypothetical protein